MNQCAICLESGEDVYYLCDNDHTFHIDCLEEWSQQSPTCPVCRASIPFQYKFGDICYIFAEKIYVIQGNWPRASYHYDDLLCMHSKLLQGNQWRLNVHFTGHSETVNTLCLQVKHKVGPSMSIPKR